LGHRAPEADRPGRGGYKAALGDCPNSCGAVNIDQGDRIAGALLWLIGADLARSAPFTENLEVSPPLEVCGVTKMPNDEWIRTFADGRKVKFSHDELMDATFITAQIEGNEVVYSILLNKAETKLSREEVERRFERELSRK
jgi:hypothetical protein